MVSKIVLNCQEEPIRYVNLDIPTEKQVEGDIDEEDTNTTGTSTICSVFCSLPLNKEVRDILDNLDTAPTKPIHQQPATLQQLQQSTSSSSSSSSSSSLFLNAKKPRKFLCLYCERTFATGSLRFKHEERCHSAKQARRSSSRFHQSPVKPTICFLCLQINDPPAMCPDDLFRHLLDAHSDIYFGCYECKERFSSSAHLLTHLDETHSSADIVSNGSSASNDLSPSSPPNGITENVKLNIDREADIEDDEPDEPNQVQLRKRPSRRRKIAFRSAKLGVKRNTRLQAKQTLQTLKKRNLKTIQLDSSATSTPEKSGSSGSSVNSVSLSENPYPAFDAYYRVKKITDHSIDNLRISSLTFDDVFDKAFYNRIKCNIRENLMHHIDGKLFKNKESDARISNFEKGHHNRSQTNTQPQQQQNQHQVSTSSTTENYGCELSLNAATPSTSLSTTHQLQAGEDILESQIEYGSKASNGKKKSQSSGQEEVRFKYLTRRKYQASILESKENRDLSRLDMWTQIVVKNRQQRIADDSKSDKERSEYKNGDEYKAKKQNEELNRVLDKRGPFEDLKEEANKQAALEGNYLQEAYIHVTSLMEDILANVFDGTPTVGVDLKSETIIPTMPTVPTALAQQVPELPAYLKLQRGSPSQPTYIDRSDKISLICSSQEIEGYNDHDIQSEPNKLVELTGEWARSRMYICAVCGLKVSNMKLLMEHKSIVHSNVWCQHYEFVGNQGELYRHLSIPALGKMGEIETQAARVIWRRSEARRCSKCTKQCNSLGELHRHILECGEDWEWMMARKKCKYRPFGAKTRKKRRGLFKRIVPIDRTPGEKRIYKKKYHEGPRQKPSDAETIQRMLANLPAKRATRKIMSLKDGFQTHRKARTTPASNNKEDKISGVPTNSEDTIPLRKSKCNSVLRSSMHNVNKVIASKILDTNSTLLLRRRIRRNMRNVPKNILPTMEKTEEDTDTEKTVPEELEQLEEENGAKTQDKTSLTHRAKLMKKKVVRKVGQNTNVVTSSGSGSSMTEKRITRNATTKVDSDKTRGSEVSKKSFVKNAFNTGTKLIHLIQGSSEPNSSVEVECDKLIKNISIDTTIELESMKPKVPVAPAIIVDPSLVVVETERPSKRSPKKRRSNIGTTNNVIKKLCLQRPEIPSALEVLKVQKDGLSAESNDFLGTIDLIPKVQIESENSMVVQKTPSLEVLAEEVSKSDASASVAISELAVNPPLEIAATAICPKELPNNKVVDLSVQHTSDNVVQTVTPKTNSTPFSKRCKRNKGLNDCIAMLTSKLLHVNNEDNQFAIQNNVSVQSIDDINKVVINICEPIKLKEPVRACKNEDNSRFDLNRYPLDVLPQVNNKVINPNILNIPPVVQTKFEMSRLDDPHSINLPSTIVPIIKIPNYPLKLFGVHEPERNIFRSSEIRNMNLTIPRDINLYPVDLNNKLPDLVAQDLTMPAIRVPSCTFPYTTSISNELIVKDSIHHNIVDIQPESLRESTDCINTSSEERMSKSHSQRLNVSTYEMKTIIPSMETIISTAEPEMLAGNPLPEEVIQKSQMLPIEAAKCDIEDNKEMQNLNKNVISDLKEISANLMSMKKYRRPVKPSTHKPIMVRSRSKKKENTLEDNAFSKCSIENKIEETEISPLQTNIIRQPRSKPRNKDIKLDVLPLQNLVPVDITLLPQSNIIKDRNTDDREIITPEHIPLILQAGPAIKSTTFTIKSLINAPSDSDDELPLSKLVKTTIIAPNSLTNNDPLDPSKDIELYLEASKIVAYKEYIPVPQATDEKLTSIVDFNKSLSKQIKKPSRRKPTKLQKKPLISEELPLKELKIDYSKTCDTTSKTEFKPILPPSITTKTTEEVSNSGTPDVASVLNLLVTDKKVMNRKKGKRKQANVISVSNKLVLPQDEDAAQVLRTFDLTKETLAQENLKENEIENCDTENVALLDATTKIIATIESVAKLSEKHTKSAFKRGKTRRKNKESDDEIPLSMLMKASSIIQEVSTPELMEQLSSKLPDCEISNVDELLSPNDVLHPDETSRTLISHTNEVSEVQSIEKITSVGIFLQNVIKADICPKEPIIKYAVSSEDLPSTTGFDVISNFNKIGIISEESIEIIKDQDKKDIIQTAGETSISQVSSHPRNSKEALKKPIGRKKKGRRGKSKQIKMLCASKISTFNFNENDNAVSLGNIESVMNTGTDVASDISKDILDQEKHPINSTNIAELFNSINKPEPECTSEIEKVEVDGSNVFTDSSIRTCSIIEATIESAFRLNDEQNELTTVIDSIKDNEADINNFYSTTSFINGVSASENVSAQSKVPIKNRKSKKKPDRKKRRKKVRKFKRMPKLKAMKAYIDSVSEDTTSKGLDTIDDRSTYDINLECLLRTNSPSITADDFSTINPVLSDGCTIVGNKPSSPLSVQIANELPDMCRSDLSSPIEEFATDCNNSFDGLIRSHEVFDVTRDLDGLEVPLIPPLKLSITGTLDPSDTFDSLASKDLDLEQISKNLDELETNIEPPEEPKLLPVVTGTSSKSRKIRKRGKVKTTKRNLKKLTMNLLSDQLNEVIANVLVQDNAANVNQTPQNDEFFNSRKTDEISIDLPTKILPKEFELPIITIDCEVSNFHTAKKFDSSIYDFDPTSEDLLLDETNPCKSPNKQKIKLTSNKEELLIDDESLSKMPIKYKMLHPMNEENVAIDEASISLINQAEQLNINAEDLLLNERSKSPTKQKKVKQTANKTALVDELTMIDGGFSPRRSRSRKSESNLLKVDTAFDDIKLISNSPLIATDEISKTDFAATYCPNVLKEINDENEINFSPRRSRSRKSETVLVETEIASNVIESQKYEEVMKVNEPTIITSTPEIMTSSIQIAKSRLKARQGRTKGKGRKKGAIPDPNIEEKESICDICNKSFARNENLMKHKRTLTHIAKLSEIEAREAQVKADKEKMLQSIELDVSEEKDDLESVNMDEEDIDNDTIKFSNHIPTNCNIEVDEFPGSVQASYTLPPKLADIISDVLSKPVELNSFDTLQHPNAQVKRYKSLGERKSFDSEAMAYSSNQFPAHLNEEPMPPSIQTAGSILKTQISILENIIENKSNFYLNEDSCKSTDSKQSNGRCPSDMSLVSDIKQDDSNIISFSQHSNMNIIEPRLTSNFLKPSSHYEEISEDSTVVRKHFEDQKARKVLNRDEELFLECCSLLKSSSEVSNFSKQSARKTLPNNRPTDDHEWLKTNQFYESNSNFHESNPPSNTTDFYSDTSRGNSPIENSFIEDISSSDTLRNEWQSENSKIKKADSFEDISLGSMSDNILTKEDSILNKDDVSHLSNDSFSDDFNLDSGSLKNEACTDPKIEEFAMSMKNALTSSNSKKMLKKKASTETSQTSITDYAVPIVKEHTDVASDLNVLDRKVITKGARKVFEGLKVSIPTNELNMKEVLSCSPAVFNINSVESSLSKKKLSKIGNKLGLKVTKKKNRPKKKEEVELKQTINLSLRNSDKIHDVYDFEETQDNTDLFNSNLTKFRSQESEKNESNLNLGNSDDDEPTSKPETPDFDDFPCLSNFSESESIHSIKKNKKIINKDPIANNNNKKKCMIMGRIFKNAFKSRIDIEISDIPCVDNNSLVENYVMNCTNTAEIESRFDKFDKDDKKKMSQEEMDALFDKLLHESDNMKFSKDSSASDSNRMKPPMKKSTSKTDRPKNGIKKRQRQNSNASDDEFCITKTQRKKPTKKKVQDNSINLEQELKECMGVAGRKSQRKCTSGKQNVLVEYWSSDDSNFEALINPDFVRRKRDKGEKRSRDTRPTLESSEVPLTEFLPIVSSIKVSSSTLSEKRREVVNVTKPQKVKKNGVKRKQPKTDINEEASKLNRRKRSTGDTLYYWSSSSDDESRDLIEVKPLREEIDEDDEDRPMQHGWIVGDSPKKLVTMLAQAKGKKIDAGVCVKEQPKKRTSL